MIEYAWNAIENIVATADVNVMIAAHAKGATR